MSMSEFVTWEALGGYAGAVTLCLLNAVIVALAANGMYDAAAKGKKTASYQHEE